MLVGDSAEASALRQAWLSLAAGCDLRAALLATVKEVYVP